MLRTLLIIFFGLTFSLVCFSADKYSSLYLKPEANAKIIGAIRNTDIMVLLENQGEWAKVIDVETGLVGWLNNSLSVPDNASTL